MKNSIVRPLLILILCSYGCRSLYDTPKFQFSDGYYKIKVPDSKPTKIYVENEYDSVVIYLLHRKGNSYTINTSSRRKITLPQFKEDSLFRSVSFMHPSLDIDFHTMPIKYRPQTEGFPGQLTANINGALYLGYRRDYYKTNYRKLVSGKYKREIIHHAYSVGGVCGLGSTSMNPWVTQPGISSEYEGLVWLKGLAFIVGVADFSIGFALGWDSLLDDNSRVWIYQGKPWIGLVLGLQLN
jgi:hypothetical protein